MSPGQLSEMTAFNFGIAVMLILGALEYLSGGALRVPVLYVLSCAIITLHCANRGLVMVGYITSVALQISILMQSHPPLDYAYIGNLITLVASSGIAVSGARAARERFIKVVDESSTDALTGLGNRRALERFMKDMLHKNQDAKPVFSVVLLDLDGFKTLNDTKGHAAGDQALTLLAKALKSRVRKTDFAARVGGDEFVVVLMHTPERDGRQFCGQLVETLTPLMEESGLKVTASIGCKTFHTKPASTEQALHLADMAMYQAKSEGKARYVCH